MKQRKGVDFAVGGGGEWEEERVAVVEGLHRRWRPRRRWGRRGGVRDLRWEVFLNVWVWIIKKRILGTPPFVGLMIISAVTD